MRNLNNVTIAICTRNRARFLRLCLDGLLSATANLSPQLLVVDNGSSDNTKEVLTHYTNQLTIVYEAKVGLSNAKNRALSECCTEYIIFLDDDGIPDPAWGEGIMELLDTYKPDVFGGPYRPFYMQPKPIWFDDSLGSAHLELKPGLQALGTCFSGGNMGWKVSLVRELGGFDPTLGMSGNTLKLGEETALQLAIWRQREEARFAFSPEMSMRHYVHPEKMTLRYIAKRNFIFGFQLLDIDRMNPLIKATTLDLLKRCRAGLPLLLRLFWRDKGKYPCWKSFAAAYLSLHAISVGIIVRRLS